MGDDEVDGVVVAVVGAAEDVEEAGVVDEVVVEVVVDGVAVGVDCTTVEDVDCGAAWAAA